MKIKNTYELFNQLAEDNFSLIYYGSASDDITDLLIGLSELNINNIQALSKLRKKVSFLMAECFQNIIRHSDVTEDQYNKSSKRHFFFTRSRAKTYYISSANLVENKKVLPLKEKLDQVNVLDKDGLKKLYLEVLNNEEISGKGGAGLGIIEMARKSGQKLSFDFQKIDEQYSYFFLQIKLLGKGLEESDTKNIPLSESVKYQQMVDKENIFMVHRDNFSQDSIKPVLKMVENNLKQITVKVSQTKRAYHILVEVLQNISKHGLIENDVRNGIFIMSHRNDGYNISAGNFIANENTKKLKADLNSLSKLTKDELNSSYKKRLREGMITKDGGAGLGLIDIFRETLNGIDYGFIPVDNHKSFFAFSINI